MAFAYTKLMQAMVAAGVVTPTDPYFNLVTLLLPGNGTNGAQNNTFLDSSSNNFTITRNGNTTQGTFSPFSQTGWSNYFDGSDDNISLASTSDFAFGTGDFQFQFFIYPTKSGVVTQRILYFSDDKNQVSMSLNNAYEITYYDGANTRVVGTANANAWNHVVIAKSSSTVSSWLNGTRTLNAVSDTSNTASARSLYIGATDTATNPLGGYLSNMSILKGAPTYSGATITVPTSPLATGTTNQVLLACAANRFIDINTATTAKTLTPNNGTSVQAFSPFAPTAAYSAATNGGSGYFDGNGDYLQSSGDFFSGQGTARTFQCWLYVLALPGSGSSAGIFSGANSGGNLSFRFASDGTLNLDNTGTANIAASSSGAIKINQWMHVAVTRTTGNLYTIYVNGTSVGSGTNNTSMGSSTYIASLTGGSTLNGYMAGIRVTDTVETISVPTAPPTAISGTALLLNFTNAGITDATAKNDLETVGNAQISTTQSKFGGASISFDGSSTVPLPAKQTLSLGNGNWTIECWVRLGATGIETTIGQSKNYYTAGYNGNFVFRVGTTNLWRSFDGQSNQATIDGTFSWSTGQWYHVAWVRNSGTVTVYRDGTSLGSVSDTKTLSDSANGMILGSGLNAYVDDLRITLGYARYTANFTAPTAAFPVQ